jgi:hypothetical protein
MHWIHTNRIGKTPWGWRDGTVSDVDNRWLTVRYLHEPASVRVWHHESLADVVASGSPVRVHEEYYALGGPFGWVNVIVEGGQGQVPAPEDPSLWAAEVTVGVTDLATGRALSMDHTVVDDPDDGGEGATEDRARANRAEAPTIGTDTRRQLLP